MTGHEPTDGAERTAVPDDAPTSVAGESTTRLEPAEVLSRVARRRRAQRPVAGRTAALVTAGAVLVGVGLVSTLAPTPQAPPAPASGDGVTVAPAGAHASSFFCATGAGTDAGAGSTATVILTNSTRAPVTGVESAVAESGVGPVVGGVTVPALGTAVVQPAAGLPIGGSASSFSFPGGGVTGTAVVAGPQGWTTAPCATQVASQWDFAGGSTAAGILDLSLYNPTAAPAVVDVSFLTSDGTVLEPQPYQGISVSPGGLVIEGLAAYVQNQPVVATLVQATSGALVATELDQMIVSAGTGLALLAGTPGLSSSWRFAQTTAVQGGTVTLFVANPGISPVTAHVSVGLPGATVVPYNLAVPGRTVLPLVVSSVAGWPLGSPYSLTVDATAPIVVGRTVTAPAGGASPQAGIAHGTIGVGSKWLVVGPGVPGHPSISGGAIHSLAVDNPGSAPVSVTVTPLSGGRPVAMARVAGGSVVVFGPAQVGGLEPLVVTATGPVTVETDDAPTGAPGIAASSGFPLGA
jgi:hypothetical protein